MNDETELQKPDWDYWRNRVAAKLPEAVLLSVNIEPRQRLSAYFNGEERGAYDRKSTIDSRFMYQFEPKDETIGESLEQKSPGLGQSFIDRIALAETWAPCDTNTLPVAQVSSKPLAHAHTQVVTTYRAISLSEFADWVASKRLSMPHELAGMASGPIPESRLSVVMDENHPDHSKELAGAIKAWLAVNIDGEGNQQNTPKNRMLAHLKKQGFDGKALERIATVCNPETRKNGGRS